MFLRVTVGTPFRARHTRWQYLGRNQVKSSKFSSRLRPARPSLTPGRRFHQSCGRRVGRPKFFRATPDLGLYLSVLGPLGRPATREVRRPYRLKQGIFHRVGVGSWEGRNFYQIRPASEVCNFYKIRPEIWDQLLHFEARFQIFSAAFGGRVLGSNFRLVRLDLGPVQDVGILAREHSAGIKTSKSEFWGGQNPHFFWPAGATVISVHRAGPVAGARHAIASRPARTGTQHGKQLLPLYGPVRSFTN